jgi:hypothetical protein
MDIPTKYRQWLRRAAMCVALAGSLLGVALPENEALAQETTLQCKTAEGEKVVDLVVDLPTSTFRWGMTEYVVRNVTDEYITAVTFRGPVGGEIFVFSRSDGKYERSLVGMMCKDPDCKASILQAEAYSGTCLKKVL